MERLSSFVLAHRRWIFAFWGVMFVAGRPRHSADQQDGAGRQMHDAVGDAAQKHVADARATVAHDDQGGPIGRLVTGSHILLRRAFACALCRDWLQPMEETAVPATDAAADAQLLLPGRFLRQGSSGRGLKNFRLELTTPE